MEVLACSSYNRRPRDRRRLSLAVISSVALSASLTAPVAATESVSSVTTSAAAPSLVAATADQTPAQRARGRQASVAGHWKWNNSDFNKDKGWSLLKAYDLGGYDAVSMRSTVGVQSKSGSLTWCGKTVPNLDYYQKVAGYAFKGCVTKKAMEDNGAHGLTFKFQDTTKKKNSTTWSYNSYSGHIIFKLNFLTTDKCHLFFTRYAHTWDDANMTGFSVGKEGFSLSWDPSSDGWARTSSGLSMWC